MNFEVTVSWLHLGYREYISSSVSSAQTSAQGVDLPLPGRWPQERYQGDKVLHMGIPQEQLFQ